MQRKKGFREERISSLKSEWQGEDENENDIDRDRLELSDGKFRRNQPTIGW